jgi:hypothetical protein
MSQNVWATIMTFGPVTNFLLAPKKKFRAIPWLALISGTEQGRFRMIILVLYIGSLPNLTT